MSRAFGGTLLLYFAAVRHRQRLLQNDVLPGGRYWDRTSDLLGVNEALSR